MSKFFRGLLHTIAGAAAVGLTAVATGWHPSGGPLIDIIWASTGVTAVSALAHIAENYSNKK